MWIKESDLQLKIHDAERLSAFRENMGKDFIFPEIYRGMVTVLTCGAWLLDICYSNVKDCVCDNLFLDDNNSIVIPKGLDALVDCYHKDFTSIPSYGCCDWFDDTEKMIDNLLKFYPELNLLGEASNMKFGLRFNRAIEDFRFHKNGDYRGVDEGLIGEHVHESPKDQYLLFSVVKLVD